MTFHCLTEVITDNPNAMKFLDNQKKVFGAGLLCGLLLMWVQMSYYQNDWSIAPHPTNANALFAVESKTGSIKVIKITDHTVSSFGLSSGDGLAVGERIVEPWEPLE